MVSDCLLACRKILPEQPTVVMIGCPYRNRYNRETGEGQLEEPPEVKLSQPSSDDNLRNMKKKKPSQTEGMKMKAVRTSEFGSIPQIDS